MTDHLTHAAIVLIFMMLCTIWLHYLIKRAGSALDWEDLVSIHGQDGKNHADWTKIGQGAGVFVAVFVPILYALSSTFDPLSGAGLMAASLLYLGGVAGYSATLRAKNDK